MMMTRRSIANRIIQDTKGETRTSSIDPSKINEHKNLILEDFKFFAFSDALAQDLISCIDDDNRNDKRYGRAELFDSEIKKVDFILTVVDSSTPEELHEYIAELAESSRNRYEENKRIAKKYKDYVGKTLIMIVEKDTKMKKDNENVINLQTELIKINTFIQACEKFEKDAIEGAAKFASTMMEGINDALVSEGIIHPTMHGAGVSGPAHAKVMNTGLNDQDNILSRQNKYHNREHITGVVEKMSGATEKNITDISSHDYKLDVTLPVFGVGGHSQEIIHGNHPYHNREHITGIVEPMPEKLMNKIMHQVISTSPILKLPKDEGEIITPMGPSGLEEDNAEK